MKIVLQRLKTVGEATLGTIAINDVFECFTLEDLPRDVKIAGATRIPAGTYRLTLQKYGTMHEKYAAKFGAWHRGMIHINDIPNFEGVHIHIGQRPIDTRGCPLVGTDYDDNADDPHLIDSTGAYKAMYPKVADAIEAGDVFIDVRDEEKSEDKDERANDA
jgi:hypothetical protein